MELKTQKQLEALLLFGKPHTFVKGTPPWNKGRHLSDDARQRLRVASLRRGARPPSRRGIPNTEEQKEKIRASHSGTKHYKWITDRSQLVKSDKKHLDGQYRGWMFAVKERDGWKCKISNADCSGRIEAHHILKWSEYVELRYDINNGITLCRHHHPLSRVKEMEMVTAFQKLVANAQ
jgi:hypothetical protein